MSALCKTLTAWAGGERGDVGAVDDARLLATLRRYKRTVAKRYRILFPEQLSELPPGRLFISTKVDGELWFLVKRAGEVALCAVNGRALIGQELVAEAASRLAGVSDGVFAGELLATSSGGDRPRVHDVSAALRDEARADRLRFEVFDVVELDGQDWQARDYEARWERIEALFGGGERCAPVTTVEGERDEAVRRWAEWVETRRFEGLVIRADQGATIKVKPAIYIDAVVVAFGEREELGRRIVRELNLALRRDDGSLHLLGAVGSGLDERMRREWHGRLSAMVVDSGYRMANRDRTLCRWVRPEIVVEVRVSDLLATDSADAATRRMTLSYDQARGYEPIAVMPLPSLIHPVFIRERADKEPTGADVGLDQIWRYLEFEARNDTPNRTVLPGSEVVDRKVWVKQSRGKRAVRKYVAWATHKHEADPRYPAFVVHFTDYSPGRKAPLQADLRVASTREALAAHVAAWTARNIKRGWKQAEDEGE
ncbi:MAG: hypothetical protein CSA66_01675 [Proteobacteria bacterium]|nr:MAG: hypothetical protein CSA66_01675 [Pseudomonadota bacterium]